MLRRAAAILAILLTVGGCAQTQPVDSLTTAPAPPPPSDPKSLLTLEQIPPPVTSLPAPRPTTQPDAPAPVQALALYAAARDAVAANQPLGAVELLQQAIAVDPDSYELYRALGEARLAAAGQPSPPALDALEKALDLHPDDLRLQALLGAQYAAMSQPDLSLRHLRLALLTTDYAHDDVAAAAVDLLLARLLQQQGYDHAALDRYLVLIRRLQSPSYALTADPDLGNLVSDPRSLWLEVGQLHEKHGEWSAALDAYRPLAQADTASFELQAKVVRMLAKMGRTGDAIHQAADIVMRFDASSAALQLLKETCAPNGSNQGHDIVAILRQLRNEHPKELSVTLALAEVLSDQGKMNDAENLLAPAAAAGADQRIVSILFNFYMRCDDVRDATRLFILDLAAHPDAIGEIEPWWEELLRPSRPDWLRIPTLLSLDVPPSAQSAKLFLVWRLADLWRRDALAHDSLDKSVHSGKPFAPAYRQMVLEYWARDGWNESQKQTASDDLAMLAQKAGDAELADEVRGVAAINDKRPDDAAAFFSQAVAGGGSSPQLLLTYATALRQAKQNAKAEQLLWNLVAQRPQYDQAWQALFQYFIEQQVVDQARKVLVQWLDAIPASVQGRILQAEFDAQDGNLLLAESTLMNVFTDHENDPDLIVALVNLGRQTRHLDQFIKTLDDLRQREPANVAVVQSLMEIYISQGNNSDAVRVLDQARAADAKDADLLYQVAHLYDEVDQKQTTEQVLQQVVNLDPKNSSACNDLGFTWADEGRNLDQAAALIQVAVDEEPDNQSFLDSMGWVLYKQGRYDQAAVYLQKAIGPALQPDPVVLDHFGDVLYRQGRKDDAARQWQRSLAGLDDQQTDRQDLRDLRQSLLRKISEQKQGENVDVAPVVTESK